MKRPDLRGPHQISVLIAADPALSSQVELVLLTEPCKSATEAHVIGLNHCLPCDKHKIVALTCKVSFLTINHVQSFWWAANDVLGGAWSDALVSPLVKSAATMRATGTESMAEFYIPRTNFETCNLSPSSCKRHLVRNLNLRSINPSAINPSLAGIQFGLVLTSDLGCTDRNTSDNAMARRRLLRLYFGDWEHIVETGRAFWGDASEPAAGFGRGCRQLTRIYERYAATCNAVDNCHSPSRGTKPDAPVAPTCRHSVSWEVPGLLSLKRDGLLKPLFHSSSPSAFPACVRHSPILQPCTAARQVAYSSAVRDGVEQDHAKDIEECRTAPSKTPSAVSHPLRRDEDDRTGPNIRASESTDVAAVGNGWTKTEVLNWPNGISMARLISGPVLGWMIMEGLTTPALVGLVLAGASDWLDGYLARKSGVNSVLGSYLDPLADKVLIGSIALSMAMAGLLHPALVGFVVARDVALVVSGFVVRAIALRWKWTGWGDFFNISPGGAELIRPLFISKVNTVVQLALVAIALLQPALGVEDTYSAVPILSWAVVGTTSMSWYAYGRQYFRKTPTKPS